MTAIEEQTGKTEAACDAYAFPASTGQGTFWYLDRLSPGNPAYNIALRFRVTGPLRPAVLAQAVTEVVRRHEALRTTITDDSGELLQVVSPAAPVPLPVDDLRTTRDEGHREECMAEEARRPFDLELGPLFRARLLWLDESDHVLLLTLHHIIADGWSTGLILNELVVLYRAFAAGQASQLPEPPLQFADFAIWQSEWLQTPAVEPHVQYWREQLTGFEPLFLPHDKPGPAGAPLASRIDSVLLPRSLTDSLARLSTQHHVTQFMTCLACLKLLLHLRTSREDIVLGTLAAGRSRTELESVVGLFVNTLLLRTNFSGDPTFLEVLERVRGTFTGAMEHQDLPFGNLVESIRLKRHGNRNPWFGVNFLFQRAFLIAPPAGDVTFTPIPSLSPGAILDLNLFMVERDEGWRLSCEYSPDEYDAETVAGLLQSFQRLLGEVVSDPSRRISSFHLPVLDPAPVPRAAETHAAAPMKPEAGSDEFENRLAEIWRQVLHVDEFNATDDFFDLGGHSLLAARLVSRIRDGFGIRLSPAVLHEHPTVRQLAAVLRRGASQQALSLVSANGHGTAAPMHPATLCPRKWPVFFFDSCEGQLFGSYTPPSGHDRGEGVVVCAPSGHEYMSTYRGLRLLALDLSKAGFHVLRFDYSCVGNSWGSFEQASALRWVRDIDAAVRELSGRLHPSGISLVGLRLGAALAYQATRSRHVRQLVLWDPVADGREYITQLRALQARTHKHDRDAVRNTGEELLGYDYSPALVRELECLDLTVEAPGCDRVSVVLTEETPGANRLRESLAQRAARPVVQLVATRTGWDDENYDRSLTLHEARRAVVDLLERVLL